jgi:hypothetical protein
MSVLLRPARCVARRLHYAAAEVRANDAARTTTFSTLSFSRRAPQDRLVLPAAHELRRRCASIHDRALRFAVVRDALLRSSASLAVELVELSLEDPDDVSLLGAVALSLDELLPQRAAAAWLARAAGRELAAAMLEPASATEAPPELRVPDFGVGRPLTLGERKSLARRRDRNVLARVLRDPSPDVVRILLENPALTEADVVRLAARRPIDPRVLLALVVDLRWVIRPAVRKSLVQNPSTPLDVALRLLPHLNRSELAELERAADLREPLRELASVLRRRSPPERHAARVE